MCVAVSAIPVGIIGGIQGFKYTSLMLIGLIFLVTFIVSLTISYLITRPIEKLTSNINQISKGKLDVNLTSSELFEINNLINSLNRIMASLKLAINKVGVKKGEIFEDAVKTKEETEKKQKELINSIKGWAWEIDNKGNFTYCSENITKILGYESNDLIGKSMFEYLTSEDAKNFRHLLNEASKKRQPIFDFENCNITKNGKKICVVTNCFPIYDNYDNIIGFRGVDTDITKEKLNELKVKELNQEIGNLKTEISTLLNVFEKRNNGEIRLNLSENKNFNEKWAEQDFDSVLIFDENANILDCNDNMVQQSGYTKNELLTLNLADFDALESKQEILNKLNKVKKNGSLSFKTIHKRKDGSAILVHENLQYMYDKNKFKAIVREDYSFKKSLK